MVKHKNKFDNNRYVIRILFLLLFLIMAFRVSAQFEKQKIVRHYNLSDGLSQAVVNDITQGHQSFVWFATEDGLNRFDGSYFKVFKYGKRLSEIPDNFIQSILTDKQGRLWLSSRKGLVEFDHKTEKFELYQHEFKNSHVGSPNDVSFIAEGSANNLWVTWYGNGLGSFDKSTGSFTVYNTENNALLSSNLLITALEDSSGLLWLGTQNAGVNVFHIDKGRISRRDESLSNSPDLVSSNVRAIVADDRNNIWIGTSRGLYFFDRQRSRFIQFGAGTSIDSKSIFSLLADSRGFLWVGTQGNGLYRIDLNQLDSLSIQQTQAAKVGTLGEFDLSKKTVQSLFEDKHKNLWIGTFGDGIYMMSHEDRKFINYQKLIREESTFTPASFYGMCYDKSGNLWLGTDGHGLYMKMTDGNQESLFKAEGMNGNLKDNAILSAFCDSEGRLWFGTYSAGLFLFDRSTRSFVQYRYRGSNSNRSGVSDVRVIFEDSKGNLWAGTNRGGLCLVNVGDGSYTTPPDFNGVLVDGDVRSITEGNDGQLYIGFYGNGVYAYNVETNHLYPYLDEKRVANFSNTVVYSVKFDKQNRLWMGTAGGGIFIHDPATDSLVHLTEDNGLFSNTIYSILINGSAAWVSSNSGISKINVETFSIFNYDVHDGLQDGQFNPGAGMFNEHKGYMCFGGTRGLNVFYPEQIEERVESPEVLVTGLQIFNKPVSIGDTVDGALILANVINETEKVTLAHDQSVVTLDFMAIDFAHPHRLYYAYKLDGLDNKWNFVGQQHSATYRYLKPGTYTFKVKCSNRIDEWSEQYTSLTLVINPPWWATWWAYLGYVLFFGCITFFVVKYGRKQVSLRRRLKIEKAQRKHERRMAVDKLTFFTEISHEFRTPLTLIMGPLEEMVSKENAESPNARKLQMVHRNANKLLNLINKLIDYRKIESGNIVLKVSQHDIVSFVDEICQAFQELAKTRGITFKCQAEVSSLNVWFDTEKFEMVLNNLISNSFKYIGSGNDISVHVAHQVSEKYPQGRAVIKIRDNGIGIPKRHLKNIFDWFYKGETSGSMNSGIGLSLAKKLVNLHKGEIFVESVEGQGSIFSVKIPLGKDHFKMGEVELIESSTPWENNNSIGEPRAVDSFEQENHRNENDLLIVEDDEEIREFLREYFSPDYKVLEAADGNKGLEMANSMHPDLIISDVMMPGIDGVELCKSLKSNMRTSHIPIILLTARTSLIHQKEGIETGADAYLTKPFSPEILSLTVKNLLESRSRLMRFYRNLFVDSDQNQVDTQKVSEAGPDEKFLRSVHEQLMLNLDKPDFNIAELADVLHMSRSLIYKKIKMLTGLAPVEYVRSLKMQEAAKLLRSNQYKVFEVVYMVGFSDLKYFRQCFAKEFGMSPSEYMKQSGTAKTGE